MILEEEKKPQYFIDRFQQHTYLLTYSQVSNKRAGCNKRAGWNFLKINNKVGWNMLKLSSKQRMNNQYISY